MKRIKGGADTAYRQLFEQLSCPEEVRQKALQRCMSSERDEKAKPDRKVTPRRYIAAIAVCCLTLLCVLIGVLLGDQPGYALAKGSGRGYSYRRVEYEGLEFTETFVLSSRWNQEVPMRSQPQTGQYEGSYEDLERLRLLQVLLPHYQVDEYALETKEILIEPYEKTWHGIYVKGDSRMSLWISHTPNTSARTEVGLIDSHVLKYRNGIEYDVQYYSRADYEEYLLMQQYSQREEGEEVLSREAYEAEMFYPVRIECLVNSVYYRFELTEDIDLEEFLESIRYEPKEQNASAEYLTPEDIKTYRYAADAEPYTYTDVEYEGLQLVTCEIEVVAANQQVASVSQTQEQQYAGIYEELTGQGMPDVLLPHYRTEEYLLQSSGEKELQFKQEWYGVCESGDSRIAIIIRDLEGIGMVQRTDMLSGHESREVKGVNYEILYHARPITYEEYLLMQKYRVRYNYKAWSLSQVQYEESYFYYPVEVLFAANGMLYEFQLSEDVDLEEFLESIY